MKGEKRKGQLKRDENYEDEGHQSDDDNAASRSRNSRTGTEEKDETSSSSASRPAWGNVGKKNIHNALPSPAPSDVTASTAMLTIGTFDTFQLPPTANALAAAGERQLSTFPRGASNGPTLPRENRRALRKRGLDSLREQSDRETYFLAVLSSGLFMLFVYLYIPFTALVSLIVFVAMMSLLSYSIYRRALLEYDNISETGLLPYLPESIRVQLTETTLHEWLTDTSFSDKYRHFMLYFLPGLTLSQLDALVDRLPPSQRHDLRRRGLGHLFGEDFMRWLRGSSGTATAHSAGTDIEEIPDTSILARRATSLEVQEEDKDEDLKPAADDNSDIGLSGPEDRILGDGNEGRVWNVVRSRSHSASDINHENTAPSTPIRQLNIPVAADEADQVQAIGDTEDENEMMNADYVAVNQVISDAFTSVVSSYATSAVTSFYEISETIMNSAAPYLVRLGALQATSSAGLGMFGLWYISRNPSIARPREGSLIPYRETIFSRTSVFYGMMSGILSGLGVAGGSLLLRNALRRTTAAARKQIAEEEKKMKDKKGKKEE